MRAADVLLRQAADFLQRNGIAGYLVGGYVRDMALGRPTNDIDIAVAGDALALARQLADAIGGHFVLLDPDNSIARVVSGDGRAQADLSNLRENSLQADLAARDFTFNAMALPLPGGREGQIIDPFGGQRDMQARRVRAVTDRAFQDDPARLARAVRFVAQLGYTLDPHTVALVQRDSALLARVAAERVRDELAKILTSPGAWQHLHLLDRLGLLSIILPELDPLRNVAQPPQHYYDVFTHTLAVTDAVEETLSACQTADIGKRPAGPPHSPIPVGVLGPVAERVRRHMAEVVSADRTRLITLKLGALFHDIAKPQTRTVGDDNEIHFYNHPVEGVAIAEEALRRLRFSTNEIRIVSTIILNHMRPAQMAADPQVTRKAVYRFFRDAGSTGVDTLLLSLADHIGTRGPRLNPSAWWQHAQFVRLMLEQHYAQPEPAARLPKLMTGDQIMKHFNLPAGPRIGELLEELHEAQATGEVGTREQALAFVRARISAQDPGVV